MRKSEKKKRNKTYWLILLLMIVVGSLMLVTVSYTVGSAVLKIVGFNTTQVVNWDVRIDNFSYSTRGRAEMTEGDVSLTMIKDFKVRFVAPGDSITMVFDVVNKGNLNAKLDSLNVAKLKCSYKDGTDASDYCKNIYYVVEYANGKKIQPGDTLDGGQNRKVKVTMKYYEDSLPLWDEVVYIDDVDISFLYSQK